MGTLSDKVAVVTGGAGGIGVAYVRRLASLGATVVIAGFDVEKATSTAKARVEAVPGSRVEAQLVDVWDQASVEALRSFVEGALGRLDILVNNAAFYRGKSPKTVEELDADEWNRMFLVNVPGIFLMCKAFLPLLKKGEGIIVNQSSTGAFMPAPRSAHY